MNETLSVEQKEVASSLAQAVVKGSKCEIQPRGDTEWSSGSYATLVFLKPELFQKATPSKVHRAISVVMSMLAANGVNVTRAAVLPSATLQEQNIIERVYFTLDRIARHGLTVCSPSVLDRLRCLAGREQVMSAFDYLARRGGLAPEVLESRVRAVETIKLGHNAYLSRLDGGTNAILNAFWPGLKSHLSGLDGGIVAFACITGTPPATLLRKIIGTGAPADAERGSLRRYFFDLHARTELNSLSLGRNGVHGSPGIIEGATAVDVVFPEAGALSSLIRGAGQDDRVAKLVRSNPVIYDGAHAGQTLFEVTEGLPFEDAIQWLRADFRCDSDAL